MDVLFLIGMHEVVVVVVFNKSLFLIDTTKKDKNKFDTFIEKKYLVVGEKKTQQNIEKTVILGMKNPFTQNIDSFMNELLHTKIVFGKDHGNCHAFK